MRERLKEIRLSLGLSQVEFAEQISYSRSYGTQLETGQRVINDRIVSLVCERFNVNEEWLRSGIGEMFRPPEPLAESDRELAERYLIQRIQSLPDDLKEEILRFCKRILSEDVSDKKNAPKSPENKNMTKKIRKLA